MTEDAAVKSVISNKAQPGFSISAMEFQDGKKVEIAANDIVLFVGPNNAGKSEVLRELRAAFENRQPDKVLKSVAIERTGSFELFKSFIESKCKLVKQGVNQNFYSGPGFQVHDTHVTEQHWLHNPGIFNSVFLCQLTAEGRQSLSNMVPAISVIDGIPSHPIHALFGDDALASRISGFFRQAFGTDLTIFHGGGASWPLMVGEKPLRDPLNKAVAAKVEL